MIRSILLLLAATSSLIHLSDGYIGSGLSKLRVDMKTFRRQNFDCHNRIRKKHGVRPLSRTAKLDKVAQEHAAIQADKDSFLPLNSSYGINVARYSKVVDGTNACLDWYKEEHLYEYKESKQKNINETNSFMRIVSKASCFIGVGIGISKSGNIYIVAIYDPPGNIAENVLPPGNFYKHTLNPFELLMLNPVCGIAEKDEYMQQNLKCHNTLRKMHGVPPLVYNDELNTRAERAANWFAFQNEIIIHYESYDVCPIKFEGRKKNGFHYCQHQYDEGHNYDTQYFHSLDESSALPNQAPCFSQMIWKSTRSMGFAIGLAKDGSIYTVAMYDPPGNQKGQYINNIFPVQNDTFTLSKSCLISHNILNLYFLLFFFYLAVI